MKIKATGDNLYCHVVKSNERKVGSIIVPESVQRTHVIAEILSKGADVPSTLNVGDFVVMNRRAGQDIMMDDNDIFKVVKFGEVYGVAEED